MEEAVGAFNRRLEAGGCPYRFPDRWESSWLPRKEKEETYEEYFVARDGDTVHGGYILKHQPFWVAGKEELLACLYLPVSEGAVSNEYSRLGLQLLTSALKKQPLL